ncbi:MAG: AI-2E family transporter, partial [Bradymonadaceae bacterium]
MTELPPLEHPSKPTESASDAPILSAGDQWERYGRYPYLLAKVLFFGLLIAFLFVLVDQVSAVAFPLFLSLLIAYLVDPTIDRLEERKISRSVSILIFLVTGMVLVTTFAIFLYPTLATQVGKIAERLPGLWESIQTEFIPWFQTTFNIEIPPTFAEGLERYGEGIQEALPGVAQQVGTWLGDLVTRTGAVVISLLNLIMIPIFTFYFLRDFDKGRLSLVRYLPAYRRDYLLSRIK